MDLFCSARLSPFVAVPICMGEDWYWNGPRTKTVWMLCEREPLNTFMAVSFVNKVDILQSLFFFFQLIWICRAIHSSETVISNSIKRNAFV